MKLPRKERIKSFENFKKLGIDKYNTARFSDQNPTFMQERSSKKEGNDVIRCSACKGYFAKHYFSRHKRRCNMESCPPEGIKITEIINSFNRDPEVDCPADFKLNVLDKMRDDAVGELCRKDSDLISFGVLEYDKIKRRLDKDVEVKKAVRATLRTLSTLYNVFLKEEHAKFYHRSSDMLRRENFLVLRKSIESLTTKEDSSIKASLRNSLYYYLNNFALSVKGYFLISKMDLESRHVEEFLTVLKLFKDSIFGESQKVVHKNRMLKSRRPANLPLEDDVQLLRAYILDRIKEITDDKYLHVDTSVFVELRNLAVSRLTLFNARRGGMLDLDKRYF